MATRPTLRTITTLADATNVRRRKGLYTFHHLEVDCRIVVELSQSRCARVKLNVDPSREVESFWNFAGLARRNVWMALIGQLRITQTSPK